jgi:hypothetical protein
MSGAAPARDHMSVPDGVGGKAIAVDDRIASRGERVARAGLCPRPALGPSGIARALQRQVRVALDPQVAGAVDGPGGDIRPHARHCAYLD